jgi:hypothetical protein
MGNMDKDRLVEVAWFNFEAEAYTLVAFLKSEGVRCVTEGDIVSKGETAFSAAGGVRVKVLERDYDKAIELMKEGGYAVPETAQEDKPKANEGKKSRTDKVLGRKPKRKLSNFQIACISILWLLLCFMLLSSAENNTSFDILFPLIASGIIVFVPIYKNIRHRNDS